MNEDISGDLKREHVKKIAVLRSGALGDFIVTLPALKAIRSAYPAAEIVLLGKSWHSTFLAKGRTQVDRVVTVPVIRGIRTEKYTPEDRTATEAFFRQMEQEHFDIAINFQGNGISANPFIKRLKPKLSMGFASEKSEKLDRNIEYYYYQNEVIRFIEAAKLIGAYTSELEPQINVLDEDKEEIKSFIQLMNEKHFIVLHPCAADMRRMWPLENYAPLADALKQRGYEVVFTGSAEDRTAAGEIIFSMKTNAVNSCGAFSLGGLSAVLSKAAMVIGADTGPLHLARAVNTPTAGIYWAPNLINWGPVTRSIHRPVVSWNMQCPFCGVVPNDPYPYEPQNGCSHNISFVKDVTVAQVLKAAEELMGISKPKRRVVLETKLLNKEQNV